MTPDKGKTSPPARTHQDVVLAALTSAGKPMTASQLAGREEMNTNTTSGAADLPEVRLFTKKPVTIAAIQWTGKNLREVITFTDGPPDARTTHAGMAWEAYTDLVARDGLKIYTLEGKMLASPGDWIIRGVKGEFYPCKNDIFEATYSPAALAAGQATAEASRFGSPELQAMIIARCVEKDQADNKKKDPL